MQQLTTGLANLSLTTPVNQQPTVVSILSNSPSANVITLATPRQNLTVYPEPTTALPAPPADKEHLLRANEPYKTSKGYNIAPPIMGPNTIGITLETLEQLSNTDPYIGDTAVDIYSTSTLIMPSNPQQNMMNIIHQIDIERLNLKDSENPYNMNQLKRFAQQLGINVSTSETALAREIIAFIGVYHNTTNTNSKGIVIKPAFENPRIVSSQSGTPSVISSLCIDLPQSNGN